MRPPARIARTPPQSHPSLLLISEYLKEKCPRHPATPPRQIPLGRDGREAVSDTRSFRSSVCFRSCVGSLAHHAFKSRAPFTGEFVTRVGSESTCPNQSQVTPAETRAPFQHISRAGHGLDRLGSESPNQSQVTPVETLVARVSVRLSHSQPLGCCSPLRSLLPRQHTAAHPLKQPCPHLRCMVFFSHFLASHPPALLSSLTLLGRPGLGLPYKTRSRTHYRSCPAAM